MRSVTNEAGVAYGLHVFDVPDALCKERLQQLNERGKHPYQVSEAAFDMFTSYFGPSHARRGVQHRHPHAP